MKIGITEQGDAALDLSWESKLIGLDGAILITKAPAAPAFQKALLRNKAHCILHATITGNGKTPYEPNVPDYIESLDGLETLISNGFSADHIVLRCDPVIPTKQGLLNTHKMLKDFVSRSVLAGIKRVRISILDNYPHVSRRFREAGLPDIYNGRFQPDTRQVKAVAGMITDAFQSRRDIHVQSCAEPLLSAESGKTGRRFIEQAGCVSIEDCRLLGIKPPETMETAGQRSACLCLKGKTELLGHRNRCPHQCIYCYWKD